MPFRYRPADNRTPVSDPIFGGLDWDGIYDDSRMANDPRFEAVPEDLTSQTRAQLNELATEAGVAEPHLLANKQAVIDALQAHGTTGDSATEPPADPASTSADPSAETPAEPTPADARS